MTTRAEIVAEARRWADAPTPYVHQGHTFGVACDCGGLPAGISMRLGLLPSNWWETTFEPRFGGYPRFADGSLRAICELFMRPIEVAAAQPGDCVLIVFPRDREPHHLAVLADYAHGGLSIVHGLSRTGRVTEHRLAGIWRDGIVAAYALPGIV